MNLQIVDYQAGNIASVRLAFKRLGIEAQVSAEPEVLRKADAVIFPGVGEAKFAMRQLREKGLDQVIPTLKQPVLGVCLGMQLLCAHTEEGNTDGLGVFPLSVKHFPPKGKVPHVGWNKLQDLRGWMGELPQPAYSYFVHSYYVEQSEVYTVADCDYLLQFSAALEKDNFYATQFHPEKSGDWGEQLLATFLERVQKYSTSKF